ncbi:MAG: hypothetical protein JW832_06495 [Deltaproteobacteria bacterium]|nr:hypothetical protein [Deltaproteobacteria bacterium]
MFWLQWRTVPDRLNNMISENMMTAGVVDRIKQANFYSKQIKRIIAGTDRADLHLNTGGQCALAAERIAKGLAPEAQETAARLLKQLFRARGLSVVYEHQEKALAAALSGKDVLLATGEGSGRSTCMDLLAVCRGLALSENTLIVCTNELEAKKRLEACRRTLRHMGLDYVLKAVAIDFYNSTPVPEIVVTTPRQLIATIESQQNISPAFFASLSLVIAEDISDYTGVCGTNAAALFRCLQILTRRFGSRPTIMATALPYANLRDFAAKLLNRDTASTHMITQDCAPAFQHQLVFWSTAEDDSDQGTSATAKDLRKDLEDLIGFLSRDGLKAEGSSTAFCFLLDKSGSMDAPSKFPRVLDTVCQDIREREERGIIDNGDHLQIHFFDEKLLSAVFNGTVSSWAESCDIHETKLKEVRPGGWTSIGSALKTFLQNIKNRPNDGVTTYYVFMYSDGEDSIDESMAQGVKNAMALLGSQSIVRILYVSLGIEPDISVRTLIEELGGFVVELPAGADLHLPSSLLNQKEEAERAVTVMSFTEEFAETDLAAVDSPLRPVRFLTRVTHPELTPLLPSDTISSEALRHARYIVVVGWLNSPALLYHYLCHAGGQDAVVFLIDTGAPASRFISRCFEELPSDTSPDRLCLTPYHDAVSLRAIRSVLGWMASLSKEEANTILWGRPEEPKRGETARVIKTCRYVEMDETGTVMAVTAEDDGITMSRAFHVAEEPLRMYLTGNETPFLIDSAQLLHRFYPGAIGVLNCRRYSVEKTDVGSACHLNIANPGKGFWTSPVLKLEFPANPAIQSGARAVLPDTDLNVTLDYADMVLEIIPQGHRRFEGGRASGDGKVQGIPGTPGQSVEIKTRVLIMDLSEQSVSPVVLCGLENILWHFLPSLTACETHPFCIAEPKTNRIYLGELIPGATGLVSALIEDASALLSTALQYGAMTLLACSCKDGCKYCLRAQAKSWGIPEEETIKKDTLEFLEKHGIVTDMIKRRIS